MRVLLVHPEDSPEQGPWAEQNWDRLVDLGQAGPSAYERWGARFRCRAGPVGLPGAEDFRAVRGLLESGLGRLCDTEGLDWWELTALLVHKDMEIVQVLRKFAGSLHPNDELFVTRPGFYADALGLLGTATPRSFGEIKKGRKPGHYLDVARRFPLAQLREIFWDKYDAAHTIRSRFTRARKASPRPVVLLPSSYENVTRMVMAYAATLPAQDFLLVTTRRSGAAVSPPANVATAKLASYVSARGTTAAELVELQGRWRQLRHELELIPEMAVIAKLGLLDLFPKMLRQGLGVRDAWLGVLEREPVKAVLCGDDANPYTHIPMLLAGKRGIPMLACHHGALDGRHLIKQNHADIILVKGKMEEDYMVRVCGVPAECVEVGAPARPPWGSSTDAAIDRHAKGNSIVMFSEFYEVSNGRAEQFYYELIPALAELAAQSGRSLVIKLHPFEPQSERRALVEKVLPASLRATTRVMSGPLTDGLLDQAWFGITILSTVTTECAFRGIPCFLCKWLEFWPYGYIDQYGKFGAGAVLNSAAEIAAIPRILENCMVTPAIKCSLWQPIAPDRFAELLTTKKMPVDVAAMSRA